jgi:GDSL-like Lipase/Acylhydrolase
MQIVHACCLALGMLLFFLDLADAEGAIRYAVLDNNRLFLDGDNDRYVRDLHTYLYCESPAGRGSSECEDYNKAAIRNGADVPNLRTDANLKYRVRYDDIRLAYPSDYATSGSRQVKFWLGDDWFIHNSKSVRRCHWLIDAPEGRIERLAEGCTPIVYATELLPSGDGADLTWRAHVTLTIDFQDGASQVWETTVVVRDFLIVAMGDSFTSGEGNPERNVTGTHPAQWLDYRCNRSSFSYPVMLAAQLALLDPRHSVTLIHVACSGARAKDGVVEEYSGIVGKWTSAVLLRDRLFEAPTRAAFLNLPARLPPQISQVKALLRSADGRVHRKPDLMLMSVGVNDLGLSELLKTLAQKKCDEHCFAKLRQKRTANPTECSPTHALELSFDCLEKRLLAVRHAIETDASPKRTFLMQYFNPVRDEQNRLCSEQTIDGKRQLLDGMSKAVQRLARIELTRDEVAFAETDFYLPLVQVLSRVANQAAWVVPPPLPIHEINNGNTKA